MTATLSRWKQALALPWSPARRPDPADDDEGPGDLSRVNQSMALVAAVSVAATALAGWGLPGAWKLALWALASAGVGALAGFLFGVPRAQERAAASTSTDTPNAQAAAGLRPNTNLEQVSDWLTKIIVGLGLVHLQQLPGQLMSVAGVAALSMADKPAGLHLSLAVAVIVSYAVEGFFGGYIYTRLFLQGAFDRSDRELLRERQARRRVADAVETAPAAAAPTEAQPGLPTAAQQRAASDVQRLTENHRQAAAEKLDELAREYEQVRGAMAPGAERTQRMTEVVSRMTVLALAAQAELPRLTESGRQGDRLAAITILKLRFQARYIDWLADRVAQDPPFIGFHAASALLAGWRDLGEPEREAMKRAVAAAQQRLRESGRYNDPPRDRLLRQITEGQAPTAW